MSKRNSPKKDFKNQQKALIVISAHCSPMTTSAAAHMGDLAEHFLLDRKVYYITQSRFSLGRKFRYGIVFGFTNPLIKSTNLQLRFLGELIYPFLLALTFGLYCRIFVRNYDIIAYSPSALQWPLMAVLKKRKSYQILILRDLFPEWLMDSNVLIAKSYIYIILKFLSHLQYYLSDIIGVQAIDDMERLPPNLWDKTVVIKSFYSQLSKNQKIPKPEKNKKNVEFGCFGTFGYAQDWRKSLKIINEALLKDDKLRFHFVGSGNPELESACFSKSIRSQITIRKAVTGTDFEEALSNIDIGFFSLSPVIKNSNIPGKFITYCKYGLPTFALGDNKSHIAKLITENRLGYLCDINNTDEAVSQMLKISREYRDMDKTIISRYFVDNHSVEYVGARIQHLLHDLNETKE